MREVFVGILVGLGVAALLVAITAATIVVVYF